MYICIYVCMYIHIQNVWILKKALLSKKALKNKQWSCSKHSFIQAYSSYHERGKK